VSDIKSTAFIAIDFSAKEISPAQLTQEDRQHETALIMNIGFSTSRG
jgi:hypothetical protein